MIPLEVRQSPNRQTPDGDTNRDSRRARGAQPSFNGALPLQCRAASRWAGGLHSLTGTGRHGRGAEEAAKTAARRGDVPKPESGAVRKPPWKPLPTCAAPALRLSPQLGRLGPCRRSGGGQPL